jgi:integrase
LKTTRMPRRTRPAERRGHAEAPPAGVGRPGDGELVFADERGRALTPNGRPRHAFTRAVRAAGLGEPAPKLHDLRHAYASALLAAGLTVHAVAELLGHLVQFGPDGAVGGDRLRFLSPVAATTNPANAGLSR